MIPTFILMKWLGWIDTYQGLIVPRAVTPFGIFLMRQFLLTLPRELEEAALIDGCGRLRISCRSACLTSARRWRRLPSSPLLPRGTNSSGR